MTAGKNYHETLGIFLQFFIAGIALLGTQIGCVPGLTTPEGMWKFIPLKVNTEDVGGGWQTLVVEIAVENGTPRAGMVRLTGGAIVQTAEGYTYREERSPIIGAGSAFVTPVLPPGFRLRAFDRFDSPSYVLRFRVAQKTQGYRITIPYEVSKVGVDFEGGTPAIINLDKDVRQVTFPSDSPSSAFKSLGTSTDTQGRGVVTIDRLDNCGTNACVWATYRNSTGYDQKVYLWCYLLDDAGIAHQSPSTDIYAGPNQTVQSVVARFRVGGEFGVRTKSNPKLICSGDLGVVVFNTDY